QVSTAHTHSVNLGQETRRVDTMGPTHTLPHTTLTHHHTPLLHTHTLPHTPHTHKAGKHLHQLLRSHDSLSTFTNSCLSHMGNDTEAAKLQAPLLKGTDGCRRHNR